MTTLLTFIAHERTQYLAFVGLSLAAAGFTGLLYVLDHQSFQRFFGRLHPLIVVGSIFCLGVVLLSFFLSRGYYAVSQNQEGVVLAAGVGALLAIPTTLVDCLVIFPKDLNKAFPQSLLFYPAIGYVVEIVFHLLPLAILLLMLPTLFRNVADTTMIWLCILLVSMLEPVYQTVGFIGPYPWWTVAYVGLHLFIFNVLQLSIFKQYDFMAMYSFRLAYYILWHIVWGYARLRLLF